MAGGEVNSAQSAAQPFRGRLLDGLATSLATRGYRDTTVADIVRNAKTSKRTFYDQFSSKEECFIELLRTNNEDLIARIRGAIDPDGDWERQVRDAVDAYVAHIASRPAITLSWIREAPALGDVAQPLNRHAMEQLTDMVVDLTSGAGFQRAGIAPTSRPVALILLGGFRELTALLVEDGRDVDELTEPALTAALAILGARMSAQHQPG
ncbi:TetR family transcriptional regulator [Mycobacterium sp. ST-F2]|uniref:TetR/AcrR family transcriptional regulator n=1 Tax=Mycobacterium sp. ST-F2 TaxID=1490484 RepID=UPI00093F7DCD|nr:TetR/AcrR family transcriptional regulator [Mycobacterium sp. ST-F2]OKH85800.1 TetR family transcriptional regulator [Mycobacterium sp. ST-F2]